MGWVSFAFPIGLINENNEMSLIAKGVTRILRRYNINATFKYYKILT